MHAAHYSSLLPELFRHKTTKVRVLQPQAILLDFHGTISERHWEDKVIFPYVKRAMNSFLRENRTSEPVQRCLAGLKNESFEQRFRHKYEDAPIINDQVESEEMDPNETADQMSDFLLWQINNKKETKDTQIVERLVWEDGFRRKQISTPLYDDVMPCVRSWHEKYGCLIYIISSVDSDTLKLLFEHTTAGNLDQYITGYVGSRKLGDKMITDTYKQFYDKLPFRAMITEEELSRRKFKSTSPDNNQKSASSSKNSSISLKSLRTLSSEGTVKPVLFVTDSGQEAKAASQLNDGQVFECLLMNRPGNKRVRSYYLSQFQYIENFYDIEFVS